MPMDNKIWACFKVRPEMKLLWSQPRFERATRIHSIRPRKRKRPVVKIDVPNEP
jgi:hypothetical protein